MLAHSYLTHGCKHSAQLPRTLGWKFTYATLSGKRCNPTTWHLPSRKIHGSCSWINMRWRSVALTAWGPAWKEGWEMQQDALIFYAQHCQVFFYLFESYQCKGEAEGKEKPKIHTHLHTPREHNWICFHRREQLSIKPREDRIGWGGHNGLQILSIEVKPSHVLPKQSSSHKLRTRRQHQASHHTNSMLGTGGQWGYGDPEQVNPSTLPKPVQWARMGSRNQHWHSPRRLRLLENRHILACDLILAHLMLLLQLFSTASWPAPHP